MRDCKNESMTDENTALTVMEEANTVRIRSILHCFSEFSGLKCNLNKSKVLVLGQQLQNNRTRADFEIGTKTTLLGIELTADVLEARTWYSDQ